MGFFVIIVGANCNARSHSVLVDEGIREKSPESLLLRFKIWRNAAPVESESNRYPVWRKQAHHAKSADASSSIPAQIDDEAFDCPQFLQRHRRFRSRL